ncbi:NAD(P)-dependent oxidoreductase [Sphingomonas sp. BK235]|uniref:NAD(P)-dependent oxidoreductase n=1 Tax=Sphingomonas sp. BK235 TaxID=2512131 RepID=UPI001FB76A86|nr:NAD(P)-dependent oxidoreductase [Sphingomonas sp. BK235]
MTADDIPLERDLLTMMPKLRLVACATREYDAIDVDALTGDGIDVVGAEHVNDEDVADHALGAILMHWRAILAGSRLLAAGRWSGDGRLVNRSMIGARLGIVGLGQIGTALACRASALRMDVGWWAPRKKPTPWPRKSDLLALAQWSDVLAVTARPDGNDDMIGHAALDALGEHGFLVNVSRGRLVDEDAPIASLKEGRLEGAALDVFSRN